VACAWSAALDESSGSTYYRNAVTEEVVWELPDGASLAAPAADAPAAAADAVDTWSAVLDDASGCTYYRNDVSEEAVWELPAGAVLRDSSTPAAPPYC
jgi:phage tail tube protein FII